MKTDMRSQLGRGKEGHVSDSVYKDVHDVRNTLRTSYQQNKCVQGHKLS